MSFLKRLFGGSPLSPQDETFRRLREQAFSVESRTLGLAPTASRPHVWAALMEWGIGDDVATLVAIADGTVSMYLSNGGGVIGAGTHERARHAARAFLDTAEAHHSLLAPATACPLPGSGRTRFHVRTFAGDRTADAPEADLASGRHPLSALFAAGQEVLTAIRESSTDDTTSEMLPPPAGPSPGTAMSLVVATPADPSERVVATNIDAGTIVRTVRQLSWDAGISFVIVKVDDDNYMAGSGNVADDGLSCQVSIRGGIWVSDRAPESLDEIIALLVSYHAGDDKWRSLMDWT